MSTDCLDQLPESYQLRHAGSQPVMLYIVKVETMQKSQLFYIYIYCFILYMYMCVCQSLVLREILETEKKQKMCS